MDLFHIKGDGDVLQRAALRPFVVKAIEESTVSTNAHIMDEI